MATASTKSRDNRKGKGRQANDAPVNRTDNAVAATPHNTGGEISERAWRIAYASIMIVAALVRLYQLELRPMHHDEGVNGFFLNNLMRSGVFRYDPSNYHGPTLYYFTLPLSYLAERFQMFDEWTVRLIPLLFGMASIWLALSLSRYIGRIGALAAGALLALSPGVVFFSRYYIHEMMFVFFTLGVVVAALRYYEGTAEAGGDEIPRPVKGHAHGVGVLAASVALVGAALIGVYYPAYFKLALALIFVCLAGLIFLLRLYDGARSIYLVLCATSAALMFATKETAFISAGVLLIAWGSSCVWVWLSRQAGWARAPESRSRKKERDRGASQKPPAQTDAPRGLQLVETFGGRTRMLFLVAAAVCLFLFVNIVFYSSFFTNAKGVLDAVEAYKIWQKTGESGFHGYRWYKYLQWLVGDTTITSSGQSWEFGEEPLLVMLASLGALLALWKTRRRFPLFAALWGFGLLAAYSIIKYKTPWLVLSMLVPFALAGGYAVDWLYRRGAGWRTLALALLGLSLAVAAYQTVQLNYVHYDNDRYIYVYAHTKRQYVDLINEVKQIGERAGTKLDTRINVAAPEYWPMPWYLREYKNVGYQGRVIPAITDDVIIASTGQSAEMQASYGVNYLLVGTYPMRPGVTLTLYVRRDLAGR
ncbi:MAG TPA: hypothetical protein VK363_15685 [Pyrinomonadaceae bacterium]|nr:hypothetical protein [Pyrinomonadaceae bacterium]